MKALVFAGVAAALAFAAATVMLFAIAIAAAMAAGPRYFAFSVTVLRAVAKMVESPSVGLPQTE